jgi:hypothetical protein
MKKLFLVFISLLANPFALVKAQNNSHISGQDIFAVSAGQYHANFLKLNSQLKTAGAIKTFLPINAVGINLNGTADISPSKRFDAAYSFEKFLSQEISIGDSLKYKLYGWHMMTSLYGKDLIPGPIVALTLAPGVDWGSAKIKGTLNEIGTFYKNPFVAPFARADLRFVIWRIAFGARVCYRYDISKDRWKQSGSLSALPGSKISGLGLQVFVGWGKAIE